MLEKMKVKAKEIVNNDKVLYAAMTGTLVSVGLMAMYYVGYSGGLKAGIEGTGNAMVKFVEACEKAATNAL